MFGYILCLLCFYFILITILSIIYTYLRKTIIKEHLSLFTGPSSVDTATYHLDPLVINDPVIRDKLFYKTKIRAYKVDKRTKKQKEKAKWAIFKNVKKNRDHSIDNPNLTEDERKQFRREQKIR